MNARNQVPKRTGKRGRPRIHARRHVLALFLSDELDRWFRARAKEEKRTLSAMGEVILAEYRAKHG